MSWRQPSHLEGLPEVSRHLQTLPVAPGSSLSLSRAKHRHAVLTVDQGSVARGPEKRQHGYKYKYLDDLASTCTSRTIRKVSDFVLAAPLASCGP